MARQLKDRDYGLCFNLFTELGFGACKTHGIRSKNSPRKNIVKYTQWTKNVTEAIRGTGGKNAQRILILASPGKNAQEYLKSIQQFIKMIHMMAEWYIYTSGSNKRDNSSVYWKGNGSSKCQTNVRNAIEKATIVT